LALSGDTAAREIVKRARRQGDVPDLALNDYGVMHDIDTLHDSEAARRFCKARRPEKRKTDQCRRAKNKRQLSQTFRKFL